MKRRPAQSGFTLLELVIVMLIIATALAVAAPSLRGWSKGAKLRDETDQFLAVTRWARTQAVYNATPYRLVIDSSAGRYWLTRRQGTEYVNFDGEFGRVNQLPEGFSIEMVREENALTTAAPTGETVIDFQPLGKTDVAQVKLVNDRGQTTLLACAAPYDVFRRVSAAEVAQ